MEGEPPLRTAVVLVLAAALLFWRAASAAATAEPLVYRQSWISATASPRRCRWTRTHDYLYEVGGYVVHLQVKDGAVAFQDSQCPDHVCEQFGWLSEEGAWAACVPAGVYVQLAPQSEADTAS